MINIHILIYWYCIPSIEWCYYWCLIIWWLIYIVYWWFARWLIWWWWLEWMWWYTCWWIVCDAWCWDDWWIWCNCCWLTVTIADVIDWDWNILLILRCLGWHVSLLIWMDWCSRECCEMFRCLVPFWMSSHWWPWCEIRRWWFHCLIGLVFRWMRWFDWVIISWDRLLILAWLLCLVLFRS